MLLLLLAALGRAEDATPGEPGSAPASSLVDLADDLAADDPELARDLLRHLQAHGTPAEAIQATRLAPTLPPPPQRWGPIAAVGLWQGVVGSTLIPLAVAGVDGGSTSAGAALGGTLVLGGGGVAAAVLYGRRFGLDRASSTTLVGLSQLGAWHGGVLASLPGDDGEKAPWGILAGGLGGLAAGYGVARLPLDEELVVAAYSGAWWGAGLGLCATAFTYGLADDSDVVLLRLLVATDVGVAAFAGIAWSGELTLRQIRLANAGGVFGAGATYFFAWSTQRNILWTEGALGAAIGVGGLVGGVGGALVGGLRPGGGPSRTAAHRVHGPLPALVQTPAGPRPGVHLLSGNF